MTFLDKLDYLMSINNLNKNTLSQLSNIPYTTIDAFYKKGYENVKLSTIKKISAYFNTSLDYLMCDEITDIHYAQGKQLPTTSNTEADDFNLEEKEIVYAYRDASLQNKNITRMALSLPALEQKEDKYCQKKLA